MSGGSLMNKAVPHTSEVTGSNPSKVCPYRFLRIYVRIYTTSSAFRVNIVRKPAHVVNSGCVTIITKENNKT